MKHEKITVDKFILDKNDVQNISAFNDRDIDLLKPTIIVEKNLSATVQTVVISTEIEGMYYMSEFECPWSVFKNAEGFRDEHELAGLVRYLLDTDTFSWKKLLTLYDRNR